MTQSGGQAAGIQLQVGLDLAFFRSQMQKVNNIASSEFTSRLDVRFNKRTLDAELNNLQRAIKRRVYRVEIGGNLSSLPGQIENLRKQLSSLEDTKIDVGVGVVKSLSKKDAQKIKTDLRQSILSEDKKILVPVSIKPSITREDVRNFKNAVKSKLSGLSVDVKANVKGGGFAGSPQGAAGLMEFMQSQGMIGKTASGMEMRMKKSGDDLSRDLDDAVKSAEKIKATFDGIAKSIATTGKTTATVQGKRLGLGNVPLMSGSIERRIERAASSIAGTLSSDVLRLLYPEINRAISSFTALRGQVQQNASKLSGFSLIIGLAAFAGVPLAKSVVKLTGSANDFAKLLDGLGPKLESAFLKAASNILNASSTRLLTGGRLAGLLSPAAGPAGLLPPAYRGIGPSRNAGALPPAYRGIGPAAEPVGLLPRYTSRGARDEAMRQIGAGEEGPGKLALTDEMVRRRSPIQAARVREIFDPREFEFGTLRLFRVIGDALEQAAAQAQEARIDRSIDELMRSIDDAIKVAQARVRVGRGLLTGQTRVTDLGRSALPSVQPALPPARIAGLLPGRPSQASVLELNNILAGAIREYFNAVAREIKPSATTQGRPLLKPGSTIAGLLPPAGGATPIGQMRFNAVSTGGRTYGPVQPRFTAPSLPSKGESAYLGSRTGSSVRIRTPGGFIGGLGGPSGGGAEANAFVDASRNALAYSQALTRLRESIKGVQAGQLPLVGNIKKLAGEFGQATKQVLLYGTAYKGLAFLTSLPGEAFNAAKALGTYKNQLQAVTSETGTFDKSLAFVDNLSQRFNVPLESARQGFVKLYASMQPAGFSQEQIEGLFTGVSQATAAFGLSADKVDRVNYAFAQMASKGQIMSEELKGQLGDVLPGALSLFAEAAKMSIPEFSKAMEDGAFKGDAMMQVLENVGILMKVKFGPAAAGAAKTLQGALNGIQNNLKLMYEAFGPLVNRMAAVFGPKITSLIENVTDAIKAFELGISTTGDSFAAMSPQAQGFYSSIQEILPSIQSLVPSFIAAAQNIGYFASSLATAFQPLLGLLKLSLDFISIPFVARVGVYATIIGLLTSAFTLLKNTGIIQATIAMIRFIATLTVGQVQAWIASIQAAIAALVTMARTANVAKLSLMALKVTLISFGVGAVLIGLDFVAQKLLNIGSAADDAKRRAAELTDELARAVEIGNVAVTSAKLVETETKVQSLQESKKILQRLQSGNEVALSVQDYQRLQRAGLAQGVSQSLDPFTGKPTGKGRATGGTSQINESLRVAEAGLVNALNDAGRAAEANADAMQVQRNMQRELEASRNQMKDIPPPTGGDGAGKPPKEQSLERYDSLQDQLAKNFTQHQIDLLDIEHQHKVSLMNVFYDLQESRANSHQKAAIRFQKELYNIAAEYQGAQLKAQAEVMKAQGSVAGGALPGGTAMGAYLQGNIGPTSTGPHFDVKKMGGGYFPRNYLDQYVQVNGRPLSSGTTVPGGTFAGHQRRGSHGWDYAFGEGRHAATLMGGAKWMEGSPTAHGEARKFQLPTGEMFQFLHGKSEGIGAPGKITADQSRSIKASQQTQLAIQKEKVAVTLKEVEAIREMEVAMENYVASIVPIAEQDLQNRLLAQRIQLTTDIASPAILDAQIKYAEQEAAATAFIQSNNEEIARLSQAKDANGRISVETAAHIETLRKANEKLKSDLPTSEIQFLTEAIGKQTLSIIEQVRAKQREAEDSRQVNRLIIEGMTRQEAEAKVTADRLRGDYAEALRLTNEAIEKYSADLEILNLRKAQGIALTAGETAEYDRLAKAIEAAKAAKGKQEGQAPSVESAATALETSATPMAPSEAIEGRIATLKDEIADLTNIGNVAITVADGIGAAFGQAFQGLINGSMTAKEALGSFFQSVGQMFISMAAEIIAKQMTMIILQTILKALGAFGGGAMPGAAPQMTSGAVVTPTGFQGQFAGIAANGATFANGVATFANGGAFSNSIVTAPTMFKFADGGAMKAGLMGEAGPEAIMPLSRGAGGRLGVDASGLREAMDRQSGGGNGSPVLNMSFQSTSINGVEYVSRDQLEQAMAETRRAASRDGAKRGMTMTLDRIQNSSSTRRKVGI